MTARFDIDDATPETDGVNHTRVHTHAKTRLGRLLCNEAHTEFDLPGCGHFASLEAFWLWNSSGRREGDIKQLFGRQAIQRRVHVLEVHREDFRDEIHLALKAKLTQNAVLYDSFKASTTPILRYEAGDSLYPTYIGHGDHRWFFKELLRLRSQIQKGKLPLRSSNMLQPAPQRPVYYRTPLPS